MLKTIFLLVLISGLVSCGRYSYDSTKAKCEPLKELTGCKGHCWTSDGLDNDCGNAYDNLKITCSETEFKYRPTFFRFFEVGTKKVPIASFRITSPVAQTLDIYVCDYSFALRDVEKCQACQTNYRLRANQFHKILCKGGPKDGRAIKVTRTDEVTRREICTYAPEGSEYDIYRRSYQDISECKMQTVSPGNTLKICEITVELEAVCTEDEEYKEDENRCICRHPLRKAGDGRKCECPAKTFGKLCVEKCHHGSVSDGLCGCDDFWHGKNCNKHCPGGNAAFDSIDNKCVCKASYFPVKIGGCNKKCKYGSVHNKISCKCSQHYHGLTCTSYCNPERAIWANGACHCKRYRHGEDCLNICKNGDWDEKNERCICNVRFTGATCENQCSGNSEPSSTGVCVCKGDSVGDNCDKTCKNGGVRKIEGGIHAICECDKTKNAYGRFCENVCRTNYVVKDNKCVCKHNFYGEDCKHECKHGRLTNGKCSCNAPRMMLDYKCICGFTTYGINCKETCKPMRWYDANQEFCVCMNPAFYGTNCGKICKHGTIKHDKKTMTDSCECNPEYYGEGCVNHCPLANGRIITGGNCQCVNTKRFGKHCDQTCYNGKTIGPSESCKCDEGYYGTKCDKICSKTDNQVVNIFGECKCKANHFGLNCAKVCVNGNVVRDKECQCKPGFTGETCKCTQGQIIDNKGKCICRDHRCSGCDNMHQEKVLGKCQCIYGHFGEPKCNNICNTDGGMVENDECKCRFPYRGELCNVYCPWDKFKFEDGNCVSMCKHNKQIWDDSQGLCVCQSNYFGKECDKKCIASEHRTYNEQHGICVCIASYKYYASKNVCEPRERLPKS